MNIAPHLWKIFEGPRTKKKLDLEFFFLTLTFDFFFLSLSRSWSSNFFILLLLKEPMSNRNQPKSNHTSLVSNGKRFREDRNRHIS